MSIDFMTFYRRDVGGYWIHRLFRFSFEMTFFFTDREKQQQGEIKLKLKSNNCSIVDDQNHWKSESKTLIFFFNRQLIEILWILCGNFCIEQNHIQVSRRLNWKVFSSNIFQSKSIVRQISKQNILLQWHFFRKVEKKNNKIGRKKTSKKFS